MWFQSDELGGSLWIAAVHLLLAVRISAGTGRGGLDSRRIRRKLWVLDDGIPTDGSNSRPSGPTTEYGEAIVTNALSNTDIEHELQVVAGNAEIMREMLADWDDATTAERLTWQWGWPATVVRLEQLCRMQRVGTLTDQHGAQLGAIVGAVRMMAAALEERGFAVPAEIENH